MRKSNSPTRNDPFACNLRSALAFKCMSQWELASKIGVKPALISRYCCGLNFPRPDKIRKMSDALGIPATDLLKGVLL